MCFADWRRRFASALVGVKEGSKCCVFIAKKRSNLQQRFSAQQCFQRSRSVSSSNSSVFQICSSSNVFRSAFSAAAACSSIFYLRNSVFCSSVQCSSSVSNSYRQRFSTPELRFLREEGGARSSCFVSKQCQKSTMIPRPTPRFPPTRRQGRSGTSLTCFRR